MEEKVFWSYCKKCSNQTKHKELFSKRLENVSYEVDENYCLIECNGCGQLLFYLETTDYGNSEPIDDGNIEEGIVWEYSKCHEFFPNPLNGHKMLDYLYAVPNKISLVYQQTMNAFKGNSLLLTAVGFRSVIEAICIEEKVGGRTLDIKINNLVKNKLITEKEGERLHSIRFLGNDSVHDMEIPNERKLFLVLDIIENLLKNLYIIDNQASYVLDTIIKDESNFFKLLWECVKNSESNQERTIKAILGKHIRRIKMDINVLEEGLIQKIRVGLIDFLALGEIKIINGKPEQAYIFIKVVNGSRFDNPFFD